MYWVQKTGDLPFWTDGKCKGSSSSSSSSFSKEERKRLIAVLRGEINYIIMMMMEEGNSVADIHSCVWEGVL